MHNILWHTIRIQQLIFRRRQLRLIAAAMLSCCRYVTPLYFRFHCHALIASRCCRRHFLRFSSDFRCLRAPLCLILRFDATPLRRRCLMFYGAATAPSAPLLFAAAAAVYVFFICYAMIIVTLFRCCRCCRCCHFDTCHADAAATSLRYFLCCC